MEQAPAPKPVAQSMWQGTSPQIAFIFGIIAGVAGTAIAGWFLVAPHLTTGTNKTASVTTTPSTTNTSTGATYSNVKAVSDSDYIRGDKNAKVTLIEYSDYECPFCKQFEPTIKQVMTDYAGKVRLVYRQFPLSFHQNAPKESEAGLCVGKLGGNDKFWDFTDKIFERTTSNGTGFALDNLPALAKEVGVDETKFKTCLDSGEMTAEVNAQEADGSGGGASGTPTTFIVGPDGKTITAIPGALPYAQIKTQLDQILSTI